MPHFSFQHGPHNIPVVVVEPPYDIVGSFLISEYSDPDDPLFIDLHRLVSMSKAGENFEYCGNAHKLHLRGKKVIIEAVYQDPPNECEVSLDDFMTIAEAWVKFLRAHEDE